MKKILLMIPAFYSAIMMMAQDEARLLRFPTIHGNQVVFTCAGDLYTVDRNGGIARN